MLVPFLLVPYLSVKFSSAVEEGLADVVHAIGVARGVLQAGEGPAAHLEGTVQAANHLGCGERHRHGITLPDTAKQALLQHSIKSCSSAVKQQPYCFLGLEGDVVRRPQRHCSGEFLTEGTQQTGAN